jgi:hypothetical protein
MKWHFCEDHRAPSPEDTASHEIQAKLRQSILNVIRMKRRKLLQQRPVDMTALMELDRQEAGLLEDEAQEYGFDTPKAKSPLRLLWQSIVLDVRRWHARRQRAKNVVYTWPRRDSRNWQRDFEEQERPTILRRQAF